MAEAVIFTGNDEESRLLKAFLDRHGVRYQEKNVAEREDFLQELRWEGFARTPVTFIYGIAVEGFRPDQLAEMLGLDPDS